VAELVVVGISHHTADVALRERLAFPDGEVAGALAELQALPSVGEALLVSTCNRVEVYAVARTTPAAIGEIRRFLSGARGIEDERLQAHVYEHAGDTAVRHVFRVASSLDSLVVGESQILGQLKSAYGAASKAGTVGPLLGRCVERAFGVAKRVRSETAIARGAANVSTVAVELVRKVFGELAGKIVLVVGAGKMSDLAARHLRTDGASDILVTNRSPERAVELAHRIGGQARPWEDLPRLLEISDVVISSTGSREPIITKSLMKSVMRARRHRQIFLIDIAVPRDVEAAAGKLDGVYLFDIDDLERVVADNRRDRQKEASAAERIVDHEVGEFRVWLRGQNVIPTIKDLRERFVRVAQAEAERTLASLGEKLDPRAQDAVRVMAESIVNKLLHMPMTTLKTAGDDVEGMVVTTRRLFGLEEPPAGAVPANPKPATEKP
jgi:glutamyl-tRNA reductase